jgi:hypothetical protein
VAKDSAATLFKGGPVHRVVWFSGKLSPMTDSDNINNPLSVIDAVNNPVVSNSDTPQVLFAL